MLLAGEWESEPENASTLFASTMDEFDEAGSDVIEFTPSCFAEIDDMLYADIAPAADGMYAVTVPADDEAPAAEPADEEAADAE